MECVLSRAHARITLRFFTQATLIARLKLKIFLRGWKEKTVAHVTILMLLLEDFSARIYLLNVYTKNVVGFWMYYFIFI